MVAINFMSRNFANSTLTFAWLIKKLEANDEAFKERFKKFEIKKIEYEEIGAGEGYISKVLRVDIFSERFEKPYSVVLKIPCISSGIKTLMDVNDKEKEERLFENVISMHTRECRFYNTFANLNILPLAKIYAVEGIVKHQSDGAVLMEYLKNNGSNLKRGSPYSEKQVINLMKTLAKLIAESLTFNECLEECYPQPTNMDTNIQEYSLICMEKIARERGKLFGDSLKRIRHLFLNDDYMKHMRTINEKLGIKPVLSHGDLWGNNVLWKKLDNGECGDELEAIIHWQTVHCGTVAKDLAQVLVISTEAKVRRKFEETGFDTFQSLIEKELKTRGMEMVFTPQQIKTCYKAEFIKSLITSFAYSSVLTMKKTDVEDTEEICQRRQKVWQRLKDAVDDGIQILENDFPEWLAESDPIRKLQCGEIQKRSGAFGESVYTYGWLLQKLRENDVKFCKREGQAEIMNIDYEEIGAGNGYVSRVFKANVHFSDCMKPYEVVLKIPNLNAFEKVQDSFDVELPVVDKKDEMQMICDCHETECRFYEHFGKLPGLPIPKIFATEDVIIHLRDGILAMESLKENGEMLHRLIPFSKAQVKSVIEGLAKVMAASLLMDQEQFAQFRMPEDYSRRMLDFIKTSMQKVLKTNPSYFKKSLRRLNALLNNSAYMDYVYTMLNDELGIPSVLTHGDLWATNMFWKKAKNGGCSDELFALIDWQAAHCGTVARDLSHLLAVNTDADLRKDIEDEMIVYLHSCLKSELEGKMEMPFTVEQIKACYQREFVRQSLVLIMYAVVFTESSIDGDPEKTSELRENVWLRLKYALEDAVDIMESHMPEWLTEEPEESVPAAQFLEDHRENHQLV